MHALYSCIALYLQASRHVGPTAMLAIGRNIAVSPRGMIPNNSNSSLQETIGRESLVFPPRSSWARASPVGALLFTISIRRITAAAGWVIIATLQCGSASQVSSLLFSWCHVVQTVNVRVERERERERHRQRERRKALKLKTKLHGLSPRANYTDWATAACRRSDWQLFCG
jgi:hypothetical protein